ncbi:hypothetical protein [Planktosalinus lacus]|uniref:hypothetical protein n=1 Tax=Planktosalinus lacus TaxID=1526573 RepID=UPI001669AA98|nr:hypothetical protein [Planktosalinus lacus]
MKTFKFLIFNFILFLFFTSLTSCSKDDLSKTSSIDNSNIEVKQSFNKELDAQQIGEYHNIAVNLYLNYGNGDKKTVKEIEQSVINLMTENYPSLMSGFEITKDYNFLTAAYNDTSINQQRLEQIINSAFLQISANKNITTEFSNFIKNLTLEDDSISNKLKRIDSYSIQSSDESELLNTYREVLIASNELWSNRSSGMKISCSSGVIAADAVGAATGLFGGPLWSIIQGAVVSIAVNEDCE